MLLYCFYLFSLKWPQQLVLGWDLGCETPENWRVLTGLAPYLCCSEPKSNHYHSHRAHSFFYLAYRIDSGTGTLHHVPPWTLALSQNSHRLTQSLLWWSLAPIPSRHPPVCHQRLGPGVVVVVQLLGPRPLDWQRCEGTGSTAAGGVQDGPSGSSCSSAWTALRLKGETNTLRGNTETVCMTWTLKLTLGQPHMWRNKVQLLSHLFDLSLLLSHLLIDDRVHCWHILITLIQESISNGLTSERNTSVLWCLVSYFTKFMLRLCLNIGKTTMLPHLVGLKTSLCDWDIFKMSSAKQAWKGPICIFYL